MDVSFHFCVHIGLVAIAAIPHRTTPHVMTPIRRAMTALSCVVAPALTALASTSVEAQQPTAVQSTRVTGVVFDSIANRPLAGAAVQLGLLVNGAVQSARVANSDSVGRYAFDSVLVGDYFVTFTHPALDSLGVEAPVHRIAIAGRHVVQQDLAIPGPAHMRAAFCGPDAPGDASAAIVGIVRDAKTGSALAKATVRARWAEYTVSSSGLARSVRVVSAAAHDNGWYSLCGLPRQGTIELLALNGSDSTVAFDVQLPASGLLKRNLAIGSPGSVVRISGLATAVASGTPMPRVTITVTGGPTTVSNDRGEWSLANVPAGTRSMMARAVGYYPEQRVIDVVDSMPPVTFALSTLKAVMDTIKVTAAAGLNRDREDFQRRRVSGGGTYITADDIARRRPTKISDLLETVASLSVTAKDAFERRFQMRGGPNGRCEPAVFLNGMLLPEATVDDVNDWADPERIAGIEVYTSATAPARFMPPLSGCGSIVVWRR